MRRKSLVLTLVGLASARTAAAERSEFENRPNAIYLQLGAFTPVGFFGFEAERTLAPIWAVAVGAGFGQDSPQIAAMTRLLLGGDRSKVVIGAGLSRGGYHWQEICIDTICAEKSGTVAWGNLEVGGEHRFRSGFAMKYFGGYRRVVAGTLTCEGDTQAQCIADYQNDGYQGLYTGVALGFAF